VSEPTLVPVLHGPNDELVALLRAALTEAEAGAVVGGCVVLVKRGAGEVSEAYAGAEHGVCVLIGGLETVKHRLITEVVEMP